MPEAFLSGLFQQVPNVIEGAEARNRQREQDALQQALLQSQIGANQAAQRQADPNAELEQYRKRLDIRNQAEAERIREEIRIRKEALEDPGLSTQEQIAIQRDLLQLRGDIAEEAVDSVLQQFGPGTLKGPTIVQNALAFARSQDPDIPEEIVRAAVQRKIDRQNQVNPWAALLSLQGRGGGGGEQR